MTTVTNPFAVAYIGAHVLAAFGEMVSDVWRDNVRTVIMPSVVHLAALGNPVEMKAHLEHHIGGKVLFINPAT